MINPRRWQYDNAVFIGGMQGIFDEARRFHAACRGKPMIPLRETGGASRLVIDELDKETPGKLRIPRDEWRISQREVEATTMHRYRRLLEQTLEFPRG